MRKHVSDDWLCVNENAEGHGDRTKPLRTRPGANPLSCETRPRVSPSRDTKVLVTLISRLGRYGYDGSDGVEELRIQMFVACSYLPVIFCYSSVIYYYIIVQFYSEKTYAINYTCYCNADMDQWSMKCNDRWLAVWIRYVTHTTKTMAFGSYAIEKEDFSRKNWDRKYWNIYNPAADKQRNYKTGILFD